MPDDRGKNSACTALPIGQSPSSQLCISCGLCCRGLLHPNTTLTPEEVPAARKLGLQIIDSEGPAFPQPCAKFEGCCTIYDQRPQACVGYKCALLNRLEKGDVQFDVAMSTVAEAHRLIAEAANCVPAGTVVSEFRAYLTNNAGPASTDGGAHLRRLQMTALGVFLDKHFVRSKARKFFSSLAVDPTPDEEQYERTKI